MTRDEIKALEDHELAIALILRTPTEHVLQVAIAGLYRYAHHHRIKLHEAAQLLADATGSPQALDQIAILEEFAG